MEENSVELEKLAIKARRLAENTLDEETRERLLALALEYEERAKEAGAADRDCRLEP